MKYLMMRAYKTHNLRSLRICFSSWY